MLTEEGKVFVDVVTACSETADIQYRYLCYYEDELIKETDWTREARYHFSVQEDGTYYVRVLAREVGSQEEFQAFSRKRWVEVENKSK